MAAERKIYQAYSRGRDSFAGEPTTDPYEAQEHCDFENRHAQYNNTRQDWEVREGYIKWTGSGTWTIP